MFFRNHFETVELEKIVNSARQTHSELEVVSF